MLLSDDLKEKFAMQYICVEPPDHPRNRQLRAQGAELFFSQFDVIREIAITNGRHLIPRLIVYDTDGADGTEDCYIGPNDNNDIECHMAIRAPGLAGRFAQELADYMEYLPEYEVAKTTTVGGGKKVDNAHHNIRDYSGDDGPDLPNDDRGEKKERFTPGYRSHTRFGNTKGDLKHYLSDEGQREAAMWKQFMFENHDDYSPKDFLRALRVLSGLKQEDAGGALGMGQTTYANYENSNKNQLPLDAARKILDRNLFNLETSVYIAGDRQYEAVRYDYGRIFLQKFGYNPDPPASMSQLNAVRSRKRSEMINTYWPSDLAGMRDFLTRQLELYAQGRRNLEDLPTIIDMLHYLMGTRCLGQEISDITFLGEQESKRLDQELRKDSNAKLIYEVLPKLAEAREWPPGLLEVLTALPYTNVSNRHCFGLGMTDIAQDRLMHDGRLAIASGEIYSPDRKGDMTLPQFLDRWMKINYVDAGDVAAARGVSRQRAHKMSQGTSFEDDTFDEMIGEKDPYKLPTAHRGEFIDIMRQLNERGRKLGTANRIQAQTTKVLPPVKPDEAVAADLALLMQDARRAIALGPVYSPDEEGDMTLPQFLKRWMDIRGLTPKTVAVVSEINRQRISNLNRHTCIASEVYAVITGEKDPCRIPEAQREEFLEVMGQLNERGRIYSGARYRESQRRERDETTGSFRKTVAVVG